MFLSFLFAGDETYQDIFRDFSHIASNDPGRLNRFQPHDSQKLWVGPRYAQGPPGGRGSSLRECVSLPQLLMSWQKACSAQGWGPSSLHGEWTDTDLLQKGGFQLYSTSLRRKLLFCHFAAQLSAAFALSKHLRSHQSLLQWAINYGSVSICLLWSITFTREEWRMFFFPQTGYSEDCKYTSWNPWTHFPSTLVSTASVYECKVWCHLHLWIILSGSNKPCSAFQGMGVFQYFAFLCGLEYSVVSITQINGIISIYFIFWRKGTIFYVKRLSSRTGQQGPKISTFESHMSVIFCVHINEILLPIFSIDIPDFFQVLWRHTIHLVFFIVSVSIVLTFSVSG